MKIFSLQSKTSLVGWSVVLGIFLNLFIDKLSFLHEQCSPSVLGMPIPCFGVDYGFPLHISEGYQSFEPSLLERASPFLNNVFWVLVVLIILSLVKYFRNKKGEAHA